MHSLVLQRLTMFMKECEQFAHSSIEQISPGLFHFRDERANDVANFHKLHRFGQRLIFAIILLVTNFAVFFLPVNVQPGRLIPTCFAGFLAALLVLVLLEVRIRLWG
jgi:hypothetical protein